MHITILAMGSQGDVLPCATLGKGLRASGCQVALVSTGDFAGMAAAHGLDFYPVQGDAREIVRQAGANMFALLRGFAGLARRPMPVPSAIQKTGLIINQLPLALAGYDLAEKFGLPMVVAAVMPLFPTRAFPLPGFPALPVPGYNHLTYRLVQRLGWLALRPMVNRWRRQELGLPPAPLGGYLHQMGTARFPVLNGFSPAVVSRPADWGEHVHITGYWLPTGEDWQPPDDLQRFIQAGPPPVFIGFGSMPLRRAARTRQVILDALRISGQRGILHSGWAEMGGSDLPANVFHLQYAPYAWLFPRMALVVHHGGSGTTAWALRSGVPGLVTPFVFDQFFWGERCAALGVGPRPIPQRQLSAGQLAQAILQGVNDAQMRQRAAEIGRRIQAEDGIADAIAILRRFAPF